MAFDKVIFRGS